MKTLVNKLTKLAIVLIGTKFFNSEAEATKWIENYLDSVLVNNGVLGVYDIMF